MDSRLALDDIHILMIGILQGMMKARFMRTTQAFQKQCFNYTSPIPPPNTQILDIPSGSSHNQYQSINIKK